MAKRTNTGIRERHARTCSAPAGRCSCSPAFEAWVWSRRDERKIRRTFPTIAAAKAWRADATVGLARGTMRAPSATTVRQAAVAWLAGAKDGTVRTRSGDRYKPSAIRGYEQALRPAAA
jgi:hypothetical protein